MRALATAVIFFAALAPLGTRAGAPALPPPLAWPVDCAVGQGCVIQHYVDHDPSPAAKDYTCGARTYDRHDGTDIRLPDMAAQRRGVAVLAAADGQVLRVRDGVADVSVRATGLDAVKDRECGNGVVVAHASGLETQYCHLAQGSVRVKPGDGVKAGEPIARVGLSGETEFPHLHFTVREAGKVVDPFAYGAQSDACSGGRSLWRSTPAYASRVVLNTGFASGPVTMDQVEQGSAAVAPGAPLEALVAYVRAIGLQAGDVQELVLQAPDGSIVTRNRAEPLPRNQAQRLMFVGKRKPAEGWPKGRYRALYTVTAGGRAVLSREFTFQL